MAKIYNETISVQVSVLRRDDADDSCIIDNDVIDTIQTVIQELVGEHKIVEIVTDNGE